MIQFHTFHINFCQNGEAEPQVERFKAAGPGPAFEKCVQKYPGCTLLEGWLEGRLIGIGGEYCRLTYAPPSTAKIEAEPAPKEQQSDFGFLAEISLSPKKRVGAATCQSAIKPSKLA
jgi:hypothetical protein